MWWWCTPLTPDLGGRSRKISTKLEASLVYKISPGQSEQHYETLSQKNTTKISE